MVTKMLSIDAEIGSAAQDQRVLFGDENSLVLSLSTVFIDRVGSW